VLAYVGNSNDAIDPLRGHAVDVIRRPRSTGKHPQAVLYAAMLEDGTLTPRMLLPDVATHYDGFRAREFRPAVSGRGAARRGTGALRSNVPAVRMLKTYGVAVSPTCCESPA
jgi:penicillin-binding protein 1C